MMLIILDKNPLKSAELVPDKIKFKQLIELGQLICSTGISDVYKPIKQGKELQKWVIKNARWVLAYYNALLLHCIKSYNLKFQTTLDLTDIFVHLQEYCETNKLKRKDINSAIFRYVQEYNCDIPSKTELPIDECIQEYEKYVQWKGKKWGVVND